MIGFRISRSVPEVLPGDTGVSDVGKLVGDGGTAGGGFFGAGHLGFEGVGLGRARREGGWDGLLCLDGKRLGTGTGHFE